MNVPPEIAKMSQLARLARPFPKQYVEPPVSGRYGEYVSHDVVTQKLLAVLGPFNLHVGEILYGPEPDHKIEGCLVTLEVAIDGRMVRVTEVGDVAAASPWKTQGERMKDAISDGIKRCAMRIGVGLHLWSGDQFFLFKQLTETINVVDIEAAPKAATSPLPDATPEQTEIIVGKMSPATLMREIRRRGFEPTGNTSDWREQLERILAIESNKETPEDG